MKTVMTLHTGNETRKLVSINTNFIMSSSCCPDEKTHALGPNYGGCPSTCQCNRLGSYLLKCDPLTKQCYCKPSVGGLACDRCEPGYWGMHKISEGNSGCIRKSLWQEHYSIKLFTILITLLACMCSKIGSSRPDCQQNDGRCICRPGFKGIKCDMCADGSPVESYGCARGKQNKLLKYILY